MSSELLYTSAPQGLKGGGRGFTTVLCTAGMPPNLADKLESFSGYKHVYAPQDPLAEHNPVRYAYLRPSVGGRSLAVVSRLAAYGVDYSGRSNKIAHHLVLENNERPSAGPAWLLSQQSLWKIRWDGECKTLPAGPRIPQGDVAPGVCDNWREVTGDAGWGGQLVAWLKQSTKPIWLIYDPMQHVQLLGLLVESFALLPEADRWKYTFATYFSGLPSDVDCRIRGVVSGSDEARLASARGHVIDLTRKAPLTAASVWIDAARTGAVPSAPVTPSGVSAMQLDPDPVLGAWETPSVAESSSAPSVWRDEPQRANEPSLPTDLALDAVDYQLAPPPMPNARRASTTPPSLPNQRRPGAATPAVRRWAVPAVAVVVMLLMLSMAGFYSLTSNQNLWGQKVAEATSKPVSKVEDKKALDDTEAKESLNQQNSNANTKPLDTNSNNPNEMNNEAKEKIHVSLWHSTDDGKRVEVGSWQESDPDKELKILVPENYEGDTGYEIIAPAVREFIVSDSTIAIKHGKLLIQSKQNFELMESKVLSYHLKATVGESPQVEIPLNVEITNVPETVKVESITKTIDVSKEKTIAIDVREWYGEKLKDVEDFKFDIFGDLEGSYGKLIKSGEDIIKYEVHNPPEGNGKDLYDEFNYMISSREGGEQKGVVKVVLTGASSAGGSVQISLARTDGKYIEFDHDSIKSVFDKPATYELQIISDSRRLGEVCELVMVQKGSIISNEISSPKVWPGLGKVSFDPGKSGKEDPKPRISFDDKSEQNELVRQIRNLFIERICREYVKDSIGQILGDLRAKIKEISPPKQVDMVNYEKYTFDIKAYEKVWKECSRSERQPALAIKLLLDENKAKEKLDQFVEELLRDCPEGEEKKQISYCKERALDEYSKSQKFFMNCKLLIKEVQKKSDSGPGGAVPQTIQEKLMPLEEGQDN